MKNTKLRIKKKVKLDSIRKLKNDVKEIVHDCLMDIEGYIVADTMTYLKKRGILYAKNTQKDKKKKQE